jgi:hypothetical protein
MNTQTIEFGTGQTNRKKITVELHWNKLSKEDQSHFKALLDFHADNGDEEGIKRVVDYLANLEEKQNE